MTPDEQEDIRAIFTCLVSLLESHQQQIDELLERVNATKGAASDVVPEFFRRYEDIAADISHYTQQHVADKVDLYAQLRQVVERLGLPKNHLE